MDKKPREGLDHSPDFHGSKVQSDPAPSGPRMVTCEVISMMNFLTLDCTPGVSEVEP